MIISFNFCVQQSEMMYTNMTRHKQLFQITKKKLAKDKVNPNHIEQNWVFDMTNFEIDFLSKNNYFFRHTCMVMCSMLYTTTFVYLLLDFVHWYLWYDCLNENVSTKYSVLSVTICGLSFKMVIYFRVLNWWRPILSMQFWICNFCMYDK